MPLLAVSAVPAVLVAAATLTPTAPAPASFPSGDRAVVSRQRADEPPGAVIGSRVIGRSVRGRPIVAWHLGQQRKDVPTVVLVATMHGDEPAGRPLLRSLRDGPPIWDVNLWVLPTYNPDGFVAGTRRNAHGVDLNRNFPYRWAPLDGETESGPRPASEPETRAVMGFLRDVRPDRVLSFHQPLYGVDVATKDSTWARRVARVLRLPRKTFNCGGICHGTMTGWFNHSFRGSALTVEYGARPSRRYLRETAPDRVLAVFGAVQSYRSVEVLEP